MIGHILHTRLHRSVIINRNLCHSYGPEDDDIQTTLGAARRCAEKFGVTPIMTLAQSPVTRNPALVKKLTITQNNPFFALTRPMV